MNGGHHERQYVWPAPKIVYRDKPCKSCGEKPVFRVCDRCGKAGWITDCGCLPQPRPLAGWNGKTYCEDCFELEVGQ